MRAEWIGMVVVASVWACAPKQTPSPRQAPARSAEEPVQPAAPPPVTTLKATAKADPALALGYKPTFYAKATAGQIAKSIAFSVAPPDAPKAWIAYRVVRVTGDRVHFFADFPEAEFSAARILVEADARIFTPVTQRDVIARPAPEVSAEANAPGIELPAGSVVTIGAERDGFLEISYRGRGTRGHGFVPANAIGLTYEPRRRRSRMPSRSNRFVAPGTQIHGAPGGAPMATVTIPETIARPGTRYPVTVLQKQRGRVLIALQDPWPETLEVGQGPRARIVGWVRGKDLLPSKKLPMRDISGGSLTGTGGVDPGTTLVELARGTALYSRETGVQIGVVERRVRRSMRVVEGKRLIVLPTNAGALELMLREGDPNVTTVEY